MVATAPYGAWRSPITAALAAEHDGRPEYPGAVGDEVWWTAPRPAEGGRRTLVRRRADGREETVLPAPWNVRSRVMEYGGRPWSGAGRPGRGPLIVFVHHADQRLYSHEPDAPGAPPPRPLTPVSAVGGGLRWADPLLLPERGEVWCVLEEYTGDGPGDVRRALAAVPLDGSAAGDRAAVRELTDGAHRFVTGPRLSPDGSRAAWIGWDHPNMPWDGTELLVGEVTAEGTIRGARTVLGGPSESVPQAEWAPGGELLAVSDRGGWWNLYRITGPDVRPRGRDGAGAATAPGATAAPVPAEAGTGPVTGPATAGVTVTALCPREEEFGGPLWKIGSRWFAPLPSGLVAVVHGRGATSLGLLDPESGDLYDAPGPWSAWEPALAVHDTRVIGIAAGPRSSYEVVELDTATGHARVAGAVHRDPVDPAYYPEPQIRTFTGPEGREIHAYIHPPFNPDHAPPGDELPPYVVWAHGGPTAHAPLVLDLDIAYFTSRGLGVAEVNYGGSTGYGREYRERLRGRWGVVDVEDCAAVAEALAAEGTADRDRLAIRGGSAGGWTAAVSLTGSGLYACGTLIYPVLDLESWAAGGTHDFESRYLDGLVGSLADHPERYRSRSPLRHADRVSVPFLILQGLDDVICPPEQCARFQAAVARRGVPHACLTFEGEGHGFRRSDTMIRALEAELALYTQVFGIPSPDAPRLDLSGRPGPPA
ncbi:S9 family peptidase [Streptomyces zingiberis]|uniref:S9 family peptidase n=1 Tax=Streptomyces zingiberis TaxID=2053010 RepID=A0ABX1C2L2_9ACTN|nr:prolyl oligopeptidase family serine peptidase [Streptomyces zingiberis]NJQ02848.1 S9 family peptidase [Streptomyces zingiberis]